MATFRCVGAEVTALATTVRISCRVFVSRLRIFFSVYRAQRWWVSPLTPSFFLSHTERRRVAMIVMTVNKFVRHLMSVDICVFSCDFTCVRAFSPRVGELRPSINKHDYYLIVSVCRCLDSMATL